MSPIPSQYDIYQREIEAIMGFGPSGNSSRPNSQTYVHGSPSLAQLREPLKDYIVTDIRAAAMDEVIGNHTARQALLDVVETPYKHKDLYEFYSRSIPKGALLYGPPGCGKTMFARAVAGMIAKQFNTPVELLKINGQEIEYPYIGKTERIIKSIFNYARAYAKEKGHPLVIFVDEAEVLLKARGTGYKWQESTVAAFLAEMDGVQENGAFVLLATNRPEKLDQALLRDGRCDRKIKVERPDADAMRTILENQLQSVPCWERHSQLAEWTVDYMLDPMHVLNTFQRSDGAEAHLTLAHIVSGAIMAGLTQRAAAFAFQRDLASGTRTGIQQEDLRTAVNQVVQENIGLNHDFALREMIEQFEKREMQTRMN